MSDAEFYSRPDAEFYSRLVDEHRAALAWMVACTRDPYERGLLDQVAKRAGHPGLDAEDEVVPWPPMTWDELYAALDQVVAETG